MKVDNTRGTVVPLASIYGDVGSRDIDYRRAVTITVPFSSNLPSHFNQDIKRMHQTAPTSDQHLNAHCRSVVEGHQSLSVTRFVDLLLSSDRC